MNGFARRPLMPVLSLLGRQTASAFAAIILSAGTSLAGEPAAGTNVSANLPYLIGPAPNYSYGKGNPRTVLTDGESPPGALTHDERRIGWANRSPITFRQRFEREVGVGQIEIETFENPPADVRFPSHAFVYLADESGRFFFIGDAADKSGSVVTRLGRRTATLSFAFPAVRASEVMIVFFREGPYLLLYEIRVRSAAPQRQSKGNLEPGSVRSDAVFRRRAAAEARAGEKPLGGNEPSDRFAWPLPARRADAEAIGCRAVPISPWGVSTPDALLAMPAPPENSIHATGGWLTGAIRVENPSDREQAVSFSNGYAEGVSEPDVFVAHYVLALDYSWRADVLVPTSSVVLPPRSFILVMARARIDDAGSVKTDIAIACSGRRQTITFSGLALDIAPAERPHGNLWSYLTEPTRRFDVCWPTLHEDLWIDTAVVSPRALNQHVNAAAESKLRHYLRKFAKARRLLLELDIGSEHRRSTWPADPASPRMEAELRSWWNWVSTVIREEGYKGEVLVYLWDEPNAKQIDEFNSIARLLRKIAPGTPVYATVGYSGVMGSIEANVLQVHEKRLSEITQDILQTAEVEIYATRYPSKTLDPSAYFRRLSWMAFGLGLHGAGVWSMFESSGAAQPHIGWSDFGGDEKDFGLLYAGRQSCVHASRRLLAFQRGLEDFAILDACQRRQLGEDLRTAVVEMLTKGVMTPEEYDRAMLTLSRRCREGSTNASSQ